MTTEAHPHNQHPAFTDAEDAAIMARLVPEGAEPGTPAGDVPDEPADPAASPAPGPAAAPAPAATAAPAATPAPAAAAPAASTAPAAPAAAPAAAAPAPSAPAPKPEGDLSAALRASRQAEKRLRAQLEAAQQQLAKAKDGGFIEAAAADGTFTAEELEEMKENFPLQYKAVMLAQATQREIQEIKRSQAQGGGGQGFEPPQYDPDVQTVIDQVPTLVTWQYDPKAQDKFAKAIEYDDALLADPDWKDRPDTERLTEAARRADAFYSRSAAPAGAPAAGAPAAAPAATRQDPNAVIAAAPVAEPRGLSDLRGGTSATAATRPNFAGMNDDAILASLIPED